VTGAAGFIGQNLSKGLLNAGHTVLGLDSMNSYYSTKLKDLRLFELQTLEKGNEFSYSCIDICDQKTMEIINKFAPDSIIHLAAQPGVRLGINGAVEYSRNNTEAFLKILSIAVNLEVNTFLYASSSSVYGDSSSLPFRETEIALRPTSIYGVTKLANEFFVSTLNEGNTRCRGLRFFSVYGPKGRPDMAYFRAMSASILDTCFYKNGTGSVARDFTYIDDVCESIILLESELRTRPLGFKDVVNIGGGRPITINSLIEIISQKTGKTIQVVERDARRDDLAVTRADYSYLERLTGKNSFVDFDDGVERTLNWMAGFSPKEISDWLR
jgi:UDP-glucuronate 4-epimerase